MGILTKINEALLDGTLFKKAAIVCSRPFDYIIGSFARFLLTSFTKINKNQVMFITFQGDYTCNPKYICEELLKDQKKYRIVFSVNPLFVRPEESFPKNISLVELNSAKFYKELARSKVIVANSVEFFKQPIPIKREQVLIETWHGSLGIKKFDPKSYKSSRSWVRAAALCGKNTTYIISNSIFENNVYRDTFWEKTPILEYGHPRNDILCNCPEEKIRQIMDSVSKYIVSKTGQQFMMTGTKFCLYAPTFRDDHDLRYYSIDYNRLKMVLEKKFGGTWKIFTRLHPTIRKMASQFKGAADVFDVSDYPDIQELMLLSSAAVTDYSSWVYDYILTRRPVFIFATDIKEYNIERGFYYPLSSTPFSVATTNGELEKNILDFNPNQYIGNVEKFLSDKGCFDNGNASRRTAEKIEEIIGRG